MGTWAHCIDSFWGKEFIDTETQIENHKPNFLFFIIVDEPEQLQKKHLFFLRIYQNCYADLSIVCVLLFSISRWWDSVGRRTTPAAGMFWFSRPPSVWTVWSRLLHARDATTSSIRYCPPKHTLPRFSPQSVNVPLWSLSLMDYLFIFQGALCIIE